MFDDVIKEWQPFWQIFFHECILLITMNICAKFHVISTSIEDIMEGGQIDPPNLWILKKAQPL